MVHDTQQASAPPVQQFAPDPVSQMSAVDASKFQTFDNLINSIIEGIGEKTFALAKAVGAKVMDVAANTVDQVSNAAGASYDTHFVPSAVFAKGRESEGREQGRGREITDGSSLSSQHHQETTLAMGKNKYHEASESDLGLMSSQAELPTKMQSRGEFLAHA